MKRIMQLITAVVIIISIDSPLAMAQPNTNNNGGSSIKGVFKSVENIGNEILSLFGADDNDGKKQHRPKSVAVLVQLLPGKVMITGDQKTCESGNGICRFKILVDTKAPAEGIIVNAQATLRPKMKKLILTFDGSFDPTVINDMGKVVFVVKRNPNDPNDDDGIITAKTTRIAIMEGQYEVSAKQVIFNLL